MTARKDCHLRVFAKITPNGWRLCVRFFALSECSNLAQCLKAKTDAKPLLAAAAVI